MFKILTSEQMRSADEGTFRRLKLDSRTVMEIAGRSVADYIIEQPSSLNARVVVFCGGGNNGGDGLVIARNLHLYGLDVQAVLLKPGAELSGDAKGAFTSYELSGGSFSVSSPKESFTNAEVHSEGSLFFVDAVFGTGFKGPVRGAAKELIEHINREAEKHSATVIAVDVPSGIDADSMDIGETIVEARVTIALQYLKPAHVFFPASSRCGKIYIQDIGVDESFSNEPPSKLSLLSPEDILSLLREYLGVTKVSHKGRKGSVLVVGGASGKVGAVKMAGESALVCGAGLVTLGLPHSTASAVSSELKELMAYGFSEGEAGEFSAKSKYKEELTEATSRTEVIIVGPGLGRGAGAVALLDSVLENASEGETRLVIDADALHLLSQLKLKEEVSSRLVLTPHPGEMAALLGRTIEEIESARVESARKASSKYRSVVVLKGARSVISSAEGEIAVSPVANSALSTAGTGDVLTGVIAAFLARGMTPFDAARCAVYLHGMSAEILTKNRVSDIGLTARSVISALPNVLERVAVANTEIRRRLADPCLSGLPEFLKEDII